MLNETLVINELPVENTIFANHKGEYKKRVEKRQTKLLKKLSFLIKFLVEDEKIMFVTQSCSPMNFFERFFGGAFIVSQKKCLLVFTNIRILHIPTTFFTGEYRNSISQILYADCESIKRKSRSLEIKYKNGKKEKFSYVPRKDREKIVSFVSQVNFSLHEPIFSMRNHLCPACTIELQKDIYKCQVCGQEFKSKKENWRISAIYPGGGYFYTGQYLVGFADALVEILLSYLVIAGIIQYLSGQQKLIGPIFFIAIALVVEKYFTIFHTSANIEEYLPVRTKRKVNDLLFYCFFPILIYGLAFTGLYQTNYDKDVYLNESHQVAYQEIDNAIDSGNYELAIQLIEEAKKGTFVPEEIFQLDSALVYIYEVLEQYDKAAASCGECLKNIEKASDVYYTYRGRKKLFLGDIASAIKDFNTSMAINSNNYLPNVYLGSIYIGLYDEGFTDETKALPYNQAAAAQATNGSNIAFLNLGLNYYLLNLYDKAQEVLEGYLTEAPNDADAHFYLGCAYHKMGSKEKSLVHMQKAVELNPDYKEAVIQFDKQTTD